MANGQRLSSITEVLAAIERSVRPLPAVELPLCDALGLTLAEPIRTDIDDPPFDKAVMDGFAVRAGDCRGPGTRLVIAGEVAAGQNPVGPLAAGHAARISTGAPLPPGADAVVMIEDTRVSADGRGMITDQQPAAGANVTPRGAHVRAGEVVLEAGTRLGPAQVAAAAAAGAASVRVHRRPRLAVLVTGDELVPAGDRPSGGQIRNSNGPCLLAMARQAGCDVDNLGVARDDPPELHERLRDALTLDAPRAARRPELTCNWRGSPAAARQGLTADVVCVSGGASVGPHDHVPAALAELGVRIQVQKVAIKPGKPLVFGIGPAGQLVFAVPGNPVSAFVCFAVFVRAGLAGLQGRPVALPAMLPAVLDAPLRAAGPRAEFIPAVLSGGYPGTWRVSPTRWQGSGDVFGLARANGLIFREPGAPPAAAGTLVAAMSLDR